MYVFIYLLFVMEKLKKREKYNFQAWNKLYASVITNAFDVFITNSAC